MLSWGRVQRKHFAMWLPIYWLLLYAFEWKVAANELSTYSSDTVLNFIRFAAQRNLSDHCRRSLLRVEPFLTARNTIAQQREFFIGSYAAGDPHFYANRDRSRWHYRFMECIHAAQESLGVASEYPLIFCTAQSNSSTTNSSIIGICLPDPCAADRTQLFSAWIEYVNGLTNIAVKDVECTRSRHEKQWFEMLVPVMEFSSNKLLMWITACAAVYHFQRGEQSNSLLMRLFLAFSAKKNFIAINKLPKDPQSTITCIFGLRFFTTVWVIVGHSSIFIQDFISNPQVYRKQLIDNFFGQFITNCMLSVDTFFVLSATLTSFHWFQSILRSGMQPQLSSVAYWLRFYRHRLLRLWPPYLYVLLVTTLRFSRSHFHPVWPPEDQEKMCRKNWWKNVLFINSLSDNLCMPWTWYIGTDFIFFLLTPIFLVAFKRSFALGLALSVFSISLSGALHIVESIEYNFPPTQMLWTQPTLFNEDFMLHHLLVYIKPQYRIGPYIIGLILGYLLSSLGDASKCEHTAKFICGGWIVSLILAFSSLFGLYPALHGYDWPIYHLIYGATHRVIWSIAIAWLIFACHSGFGGLLNKLLSLRIFLPLAAASYSTYLVHMIVIMASFLKASFPIFYNGPLTFLSFCAMQVLGSYFIGAITLFIVEMPAVNIIRILLYTSTTPKKADDSEMRGKLVES